MKNTLLYLVSFIMILDLSTQKALSQTLSCKLNIDATGKYFQIGNPGGTNPRWVMKGTHSAITHLTPDASDPTRWEGESHLRANWDNKDAQLTGMRNYGLNTVRIWMPGPIGRDNPNPSYTGSTMSQHYDELVQYISLCKQKGLWVIVEDWWAGYLMDGNTASYYDSNEWHDKNLYFIQKLIAAGCDNVMFGTGNEEGQIRTQAGKNWTGNWKDNTKLMIAGYRRLGYIGPVLVDVSGWDNQPGDVSSFAEIQNSDPAKNIGFQEHEYFNWNGAANGYFYMPVCRAGYNGGMACENFPMFVTEYAYTTDWVVDAFANLARNNNLGGMSYFWYNNIYEAATVNGDGINLNAAGISSKDRYWLAAGIPGGYYPSGSNVSVIGISLSPTSVSVAVGGTTQLFKTVSPSNATNQTVSWSSANNSIATVNASGLVTGMAGGSVTITATTQDGNKTATSAITVTPVGSCINPTIGNGGFEMGNTSSWAGSYGNIVVVISAPYSGTYCGQINGGTAAFGQIITVSQNKSYTLSGWLKNTSGSSIRLGVKNYGGLEINSPSISTGWNQVNINFTTGAGNTSAEIYAWQDGGTGAVWVDNVSITCQGNSSIPVSGVTLSPASASIAVGSITQLAATFSPSNATNQNISWTSSNNSVATVNTNGLVTGVSAGSTNITVTTQDGNKTAVSAITISGGSGGTAIPGKIEAENYSSMSGIQSEGTTDTGSGLNVGWTDNGDYMNYNVNVVSAGTYTVDLRVASILTGSQIQIKSGLTVLSTVTVPNTGGWQNWQTITSSSFSLAAGSQTLQVYISAGGWNLNWMQFNQAVGNKSLALNYPVTDSSVYMEGRDAWLAFDSSRIRIATYVNPSLLKVRLMVYPNPTSNGVINVRMEGQQENVFIQIYTIHGITEYIGTLYKGETKRINRLNTGVHLIKLFGKNMSEVRKIVVIK